MKMRPNHYDALKKTIERIVDKYPEIYGYYKDNNLSEERYGWDLLHLSKFDTGVLYEYLSDCHIDTALRKITNTKQ